METYREVPQAPAPKWWRAFTCWRRGHVWEDVSHLPREKRPCRSASMYHEERCTQVCTRCGKIVWGECVHTFFEQLEEYKKNERLKKLVSSKRQGGIL